MSTAKHTPGPWETDGYRIFQRGGGPGTIAKMVNQSSTFAQQVAADANLIAAAPELLEALEGVLPIARARAGKTPLASIAAAEAAIAKARGGA